MENNVIAFLIPLAVLIFGCWYIVKQDKKQR